MCHTGRTGTRWGRGRRVLIGALWVVAAMALPVAGDDNATRNDLDAAQRLGELKEAASSHVIEREGDQPVRLTLAPEPALRWTNPLRVAYDGAVFVWVADGRPEVVASFYRNVERRVAWEHHEFQSLSEAPLTATFHERTVWAPRSPGVALKPVPGAPAPAADAAERLRQMRALVRDFHAGYGNEQKSQGLSLRLLTKPLYRYETSAPSQPDGAVFAFVQATDPEALLVLETRSAAGATAWHYSFAPMSGRGLRGWHKDALVWEVRVMGQGTDAPYRNIAEAVPPR